MLEVIMLVAMCRYLNRTATAKGRPGWPFAVLMVFGWVAAVVDPARILVVTAAAYVVVALGTLLVPGIRGLGRTAYAPAETVGKPSGP